MWGAGPTLPSRISMGDGLLDLVVANKERYLGPGMTPALLARFRNVGTPEAPAFAQLDTNWLSLPDFGLESVVLAFGDLDGDGDEDLLLGDELGNLHRWDNIAEEGMEMDLVLSEPAIAPNGRAIAMYPTGGAVSWSGARAANPRAIRLHRRSPAR